MPTARQNLSQLLKFRLNEKKIPTSYIASRCHVVESVVLRWLDGTLVPNSGEWTDLNKYILRNSAPDSLWQEAKREQDEEHRKKLRSLDNALSPEETSFNVVTNVGDKIREANVLPGLMKRRIQVPAPSSPDRNISSREERRRYAKGIILQRPGIKIGGADGLQVLLRQRFKIGINPKIIPEIRREIANEHKHADVQIPEHIPLETPKAPVQVSSSHGTHNPKDLAASVELILGAVPGLQQLTITVQESGEVSIEYKIKKIEVQTVDGSLTLRVK